jgi:hypothetical protein
MVAFYLLASTRRNCVMKKKIYFFFVKKRKKKNSFSSFKVQICDSVAVFKKKEEQKALPIH